MDGRPDAGPRIRADGRATRLLVGRQDLAEGGHVVDRDDHLEIERLARPGVHDPDLASRTHAGHEPADRIERPLRGGQPDPLRRSGIGRPEALEPLEAQREVGASLGAGDRVDLVDDHVLHAAEDLAGGARQHQVERLGGRDQDVRWVPGDLATVVGRACRRCATRR